MAPAFVVDSTLVLVEIAFGHYVSPRAVNLGGRFPDNRSTGPDAGRTVTPEPETPPIPVPDLSYSSSLRTQRI